MIGEGEGGVTAYAGTGYGTARVCVYEVNVEIRVIKVEANINQSLPT